MKRQRLHILLVGVLFAAVLAGVSYSLLPAGTTYPSGRAELPVQEDALDCYVLSEPAERPFAIEQNGGNLIVPSMSARQWNNPQVLGILSDIARRTFSSRKQSVKNCRFFCISLPPESIAFPFSSFW